jgi:hypothetical protein
MKRQTSIIFLAVIVFAFLLRGAFLINQIENIDSSIQSNRNFSKENIDLFCHQIEHFKYFLYSFSALIISIIAQLHPFKKNKNVKTV